MTPSPFKAFDPKALAFLRALKRHNDRDWFRARKDEYERLLRLPMIGAVERLAVDLRAFAPELVANPKASLYRIYRDTRFSDDKSPLKTHVAAVFPCRGLGKHVGAGLVLRDLARLGLGGRRHVRTRRVDAADGSRSHRRQSAAMACGCRITSVPPRRWRTGRREAAARAARLSERPPGGRVPQVPTVSGRARVPSGFRDKPGLLFPTPRHFPADCAIDALSERTSAEGTDCGSRSGSHALLSDALPGTGAELHSFHVVTLYVQWASPGATAGK